MTSPTVEEALKPCPFCGSSHLLKTELDGIICKDCHGQVLGAGGMGDVAIWNSRVPLPIEAQGGETVGRTGSVISNAIHDLWFATTIISSSTWADADKQKVRDALNRVEAALTRPDPSLGSREAGETFAALKELTFYAETSGGTAGHDAGLCGAIKRAKRVLASPPSLGMEGVREAAEQFLHDVEDGLTWNSSSSQCLDRIRYLTVLFRQALASISTPSGEGEA